MCLKCVVVRISSKKYNMALISQITTKALGAVNVIVRSSSRRRRRKGSRRRRRCGNRSSIDYNNRVIVPVIEWNYLDNIILIISV